MSSESNKIEISAAKRARFEVFFEEFLETYPSTEEGQQHIKLYESSRQKGRENFEQIVAADDRGEDVTDQVLLKLLPYEGTSINREQGAWTPLYKA